MTQMQDPSQTTTCTFPSPCTVCSHPRHTQDPSQTTACTLPCPHIACSHPRHRPAFQHDPNARPAPKHHLHLLQVPAFKLAAFIFTAGLCPNATQTSPFNPALPPHCLLPITDLRSNTTQTQDPSQSTTFTYSKTLGLGLCSSDPIPSPDTIQYPFEQLGVYAHTFEVQPSNASGTDPVLPTPRHGHAVAYADDPLLEPAWGVGGVLILFGGELGVCVGAGGEEHRKEEL